MAGELFPCQRVRLSSPCVNPRELALTWIDKRESENWALISGNSLASEIHAWCAHEVLMRNNSRGTMKSNSLDGEFLRLLSGTHHVATSFSRAGLVKGEEFAWIVDLSGEASMDDFTKIAEEMSFQITGQRPNLEIFDHHRLGIEGEKSENAAIGHIHLADLR